MSGKQESKPLLGSDDDHTEEHLYPDIVRDLAATDAGINAIGKADNVQIFEPLK